MHCAQPLSWCSWLCWHISCSRVMSIPWSPKTKVAGFQSISCQAAKYCECLRSWYGTDLHWQSLSLKECNTCCSFKANPLYIQLKLVFSTCTGMWLQHPTCLRTKQAPKHEMKCWNECQKCCQKICQKMPRVITVRQFPPSESFNNLVILESPKSEKQGSWLYPCLPAKKRLKIRYQSIWGSAQQVCFSIGRLELWLHAKAR